MRTFKLAMGQMLVEGGKPAGNFERACGLIAQAAGRGAELIVLPECLDLGWTHSSARDQAQPIPGPRSQALCDAAHRAGIHVSAGLTERAGTKIYNTALLISPEGELLLTHRKINILDIALDIYDSGDRLGVAQTPLGTIGLNICADNSQPSLVLGHALGCMGAQVIVSPSAWAVDADHDNAANPYMDWEASYAQLARTHGLTVVGVSNVGPVTGGPWNGRKCIGCSLAVGPDGQTIHKADYGEDAQRLDIIDVQPKPRPLRGGPMFGQLSDRGFAVNAPL